MSLKAWLRSGLTKAREVTEGSLAAFKTPQQWTHQVHDKANHALWFAGHIAVVDNFMVSLLAPERALALPGYDEKFGMGSTPTPDPDDYPPPDEVLAAMRERREALLGVLDELDEADFDKPTPEGTPDFLPTYGSVFQLDAWHEGFHLGQVSVAARALGTPPRV